VPHPHFTKVDEVEVHQGFRFTVNVLHFEAPDGTVFERNVVRHAGAVGVVPYHEDGTVTLLTQFRASIEADLIELPAGMRDVEGEPDIETAERELEEEAGLRAGKLEPLVRFHNAPGYSDEWVQLYLATDLTEVADDRQGIEEQVMTVERVPLAEALAWCDEGRITDAKTIIGLSALDRRLR
jgi:ADP-ribose pyrophosphatase